MSQNLIVDNFTSFLAQSQLVDYKNSIDISNNELRPKHYTTGVDLELGPVEGVNPAADKAFINPQGNNIKRTGDIITLNYNEVEWFKQTAATRSESVTPFILSYWFGSVELTPASDNWLDTQRLEANIINVEGNFAAELASANREFGVDLQTGFAATIWNSWETLWTGETNRRTDRRWRRRMRQVLVYLWKLRIK